MTRSSGGGWASMKPDPTYLLIWASRRELLNIFHADSSGCHVVTVTNDIPKKPTFVDKDFLAYCLDTVKMFHDDAKAAGFALLLANLEAKP